MCPLQPGGKMSDSPPTRGTGVSGGHAVAFNSRNASQHMKQEDSPGPCPSSPNSIKSSPTSSHGGPPTPPTTPCASGANLHAIHHHYQNYHQQHNQPPFNHQLSSHQQHSSMEPPVDFSILDTEMDKVLAVPEGGVDGAELDQYFPHNSGGLSTPYALPPQNPGATTTSGCYRPGPPDDPEYHEAVSRYHELQVNIIKENEIK